MKRFIRVLAFLLVFAAILLWVQALVVPNRDWPSNDRRMKKNFAGLLNEQANTMDVYWLGTSHVYEAISPMEIYRVSGVRSNVVAAPGQRLPTAYYMLKEVMGKQSPAIVALDASALFFTEEENKEKADRRVTLTMPGWLVDELDAEARHLASTRQAVINTRLADYYEARKGRIIA